MAGANGQVIVTHADGRTSATIPTGYSAVVSATLADLDGDFEVLGGSTGGGVDFGTSPGRGTTDSQVVRAV